MPVVLIFTVLLLLSYALTRKCQNPEKAFLVLSWILIVVIWGSRHNWYSFSDEGMYYLQYKSAIGTDYNAYLSGIVGTKDLGYYQMIWYLAKMVPIPQFLLYFECGFVTLSVFLLIYRKCEDVFLPTIMFVFGGLLTFYFSAFRQAFAFAFVCIAYLIFERYQRSGKIRHLIFVVALMYIAFSMHRSAIAFIPFLVLLFFKSKRIRGAIVFGFYLLLLVTPEWFLSMGNELTNSDFGTGTAESLIGFVMQMVLLLTPLLIYAINQYSDDEVSAQIDSIRSGALIGIGLYLLRLYSLVFERTSFYYILFSYILLGMPIYRRMSLKSEKTIKVCLTIFVILLFLWRIYNTRIGKNFVFFWE